MRSRGGGESEPIAWAAAAAAQIAIDGLISSIRMEQHKNICLSDHLLLETK